MGSGGRRLLYWDRRKGGRQRPLGREEITYAPLTPRHASFPTGEIADFVVLIKMPFSCEIVCSEASVGG